MRSIRDRFVGAVEETARTAMGMFYVWIRGGVDYRRFFESTLSAFIQLSRDEHTPIAYAPTHEQVLATLDARPHIVVEIFHGLAIQQWHEFLADLYRAGVRASLEAPTATQLRLVSFKLRLDRLAVQLPGSLQEAVADAARDEFAFGDNDDKLDRIARMLDRREAMSGDAIRTHRDVIRQNVLVRNVLQHAGGVVREDDVRRNGGPFTCDAGRATVPVNVGELVHRTVFDLEKCVLSMVAVARALVV